MRANIIYLSILIFRLIFRLKSTDYIALKNVIDMLKIIRTFFKDEFSTALSYDADNAAKIKVTCPLKEAIAISFHRHLEP